MKKRNVFFLAGSAISALLLWSIKKPDDSEIFTKTLGETKQNVEVVYKGIYDVADKVANLKGKVRKLEPTPTMKASEEAYARLMKAEPIEIEFKKSNSAIPQGLYAKAFVGTEGTVVILQSSGKGLPRDVAAGYVFSPKTHAFSIKDASSAFINSENLNGPKVIKALPFNKGYTPQNSTFFGVPVKANGKTQVLVPGI